MIHPLQNDKNPEILQAVALLSTAGEMQVVLKAIAERRDQVRDEWEASGDARACAVLQGRSAELKDLLDIFEAAQITLRQAREPATSRASWGA